METQQKPAAVRAIRIGISTKTAVTLSAAARSRGQSLAVGLGAILDELAARIRSYQEEYEVLVSDPSDVPSNLADTVDRLSDLRSLALDLEPLVGRQFLQIDQLVERDENLTRIEHARQKLDSRIEVPIPITWDEEDVS